MNHNRYEEWIQLSLYDELNEKEQAELNEHLLECSECAKELRAMKKFYSLLEELMPAEHSEAYLNESRQQLRRALIARRSMRWQNILDHIQDRLFPQYKIVFGGVVMVALGIIIGYAIFVSPQPKTQVQSVSTQNTVTEGDVRITNVRFLAADAPNGEVEFAFDAVKPVHMRGNINDEKIQKVLTHAMLNEQNPGVRLRSVSAIGSRTIPDNDVKIALITALKTDENPGVRKEAMQALRKYSLDKEIKSAFLFVLTHDSNPGLRIAAINQLDSASAAGSPVDQDLLNVLKDKMHSDDNNYIRLRAKAVVEEIKQ